MQRCCGTACGTGLCPACGEGCTLWPVLEVAQLQLHALLPCGCHIPRNADTVPTRSTQRTPEADGNIWELGCFAQWLLKNSRNQRDFQECLFTTCPTGCRSGSSPAHRGKQVPPCSSCCVQNTANGQAQSSCLLLAGTGLALALILFLWQAFCGVFFPPLKQAGKGQL